MTRSISKDFIIKLTCCQLMAMVLFTTSAQARIFNLTAEYFASYFLATGGTANFAKATFDGETSSTQFTYDKSWATNMSGEFGFIYLVNYLGLRFGMEVFKPSTLSDISALDNSSNSSYTLSSSITGYAPKIGIEFYFVKTNSSRIFLLTYYGSANVNYRNEYTNVSVTGITDHSLEAKGSGPLYGGTLGLESSFSDTTTILLEAGYRSLKIAGFNYSKINPAGSATFNATPAVGDAVLLNDGNPRTLDLSGPYASIGFRFYM